MRTMEVKEAWSNCLSISPLISGPHPQRVRFHLFGVSICEGWLKGGFENVRKSAKYASSRNHAQKCQERSHLSKPHTHPMVPTPISRPLPVSG